MRKLFFTVVLFLFSLSLSAFEVPALKSRVNDYANIISSETKGKLEALLKDYEDKTSNQFFVLTIDTIADAGSIEQYGVSVADKWKAGKKGKDNGLLLIVAVQERKVRFEVGYGLEGKFPDVVAFRIIKNNILPDFRSGDYTNGIVVGVVSAIKAIEPDYTSGSSEVVVKEKKRGVRSISSLIFFIIFFVGLILNMIFSPLTSRRGSHGFWGGLGGGGFGGGGGGGFGGGGFGGGGGGFGGGGSSGGW